MELAKGKKGNLIDKTWQRCKSIGRGLKSSTSSPPRVAGAVALGMTKKSKSWPRMITLGSPEAQEYHNQCQEKRESTHKKVKGCFSVYVGPEKQKFMVKTEYANHPLFKMLLEEAESEFGYDSQGPLMLPCNVDIFYRVLMEMDDDDNSGAAADKIHPGCGFVKRHASYHLLSPSRMVAINQF